MGARIGGESHRFLSPVVPDFLLKEREDFLLKERELMGSGKKSMEWDLNDWKWDGNLFLASPLKSDPPDCRNKQFLPAGSRIPANAGLSNSSSSCSDEIDVEGGRGKGELEKRRRVVMVKEDKLNDEAGSLTLNLGGHFYPVTEAEVANLEGKKNNLQGLNASRSVCQVEGCGADLSNSRDYHRRHKVCEMHSKATEALVGNVMQRFCQQCSRFHILQEFDEGKRSCRRRLAGHNRRRRKTHPDAVVGGSSLNDDRASSYLLITLLRILSNLHCNYLNFLTTYIPFLSKREMMLDYFLSKSFISICLFGIFIVHDHGLNFGIHKADLKQLGQAMLFQPRSRVAAATSRT